MFTVNIIYAAGPRTSEWCFLAKIDTRGLGSIFLNPHRLGLQRGPEYISISGGPDKGQGSICSVGENNGVFRFALRRVVLPHANANVLRTWIFLSSSVILFNKWILDTEGFRILQSVALVLTFAQLFRSF